MKVDSYSIRGFVANFTDVRSSQVDLDQLVTQYRLNNNSKDYATIYNKVLGVILKFGRQCDVNLGITEEDIYSQGMLTLLRALDPVKGWKPESNVRFITYFHLLIRNDIITLCNKKCQREYKNYVVSLDELLCQDNENSEAVNTIQFKEEDSLSNHLEYKKESPVVAMHKLMAQFDEVKDQLAFNLGLPLSKLELTMLAAKIKIDRVNKKKIDQNDQNISLVSIQEKQYFNDHKKDYSKVKKFLKSLV